MLRLAADKGEVLGREDNVDGASVPFIKPANPSASLDTLEGFGMPADGIVRGR